MEGLKLSTCTSLRSMLNQIVFSNMSQVSNSLGFHLIGQLLYLPSFKKEQGERQDPQSLVMSEIL